MQEQNGKERAEYGKRLIEILSKELTIAYGKGFGTRNLWLFKQFYQTFNDLEILPTRVQNLTWSHIRTTLRVENPVFFIKFGGVSLMKLLFHHSHKPLDNLRVVVVKEYTLAGVGGHPAKG